MRSPSLQRISGVKFLANTLQVVLALLRSYLFLHSQIDHAQ